MLSLGRGYLFVQPMADEGECSENLSENNHYFSKFYDASGTKLHTSPLKLAVVTHDFFWYTKRHLEIL